MTEPDQAAQPLPEPAFKRIRGRAVVAAFVLLPFVVFACANQQYSSMFSLLVAPVGAMLLLALVNLPLRLWTPRLAFNQPDFLVIWAILSVGSAVGSEWAWVEHSAMHMFAVDGAKDPTIQKYFLKEMPDWLAIKDPDKVMDIAHGGRGFWYVVGKLPIFWPLYLGWAGLFLAISLACYCVNSLMRGAWCKTERLTFPLIQLPVAINEKGGAGPMWRSKTMWIAFGVMFAIDILNGFNFLYPNLPRVPVKDLAEISWIFTEPPWNQIGQFSISIYPFMAAIAVFMPNDLIFSLVFFFLLRKATHVVLASYGYPQGTFAGTYISPGPPYFDEQTWGGVIAMFLGALWVSRSYLRGVWRAIWTGEKEDDGGITHRWAFLMLLFSFGVVVWYGLVGSLSVAYMVPYFGLFLVFSFVLTRIRAQLGPPTHEFAFFGPNSIMHRFLGNQWVTNRQAVWVNQVFIIMNRIYRTHPQPYQLETLKMGQMEGLNLKRIFGLTFASSAVALLLAYFFLHVFSYRTGEYRRWDDGLYYLQNMVNNRHGPDVIGITMTVFGFAVVALLDFVRFRVPAFPLHPAGYVLAMNFGVDYYWFGILVVLLIKRFVQRYYGLKGYDKLRDAALGILVAEYAADAIWMVMAIITRQSTYTISFGERGLGAQ
ncbi:MAG: hypothetical protein HZC36_16015 [Armatimonadetes bacterium]|nr:hypothetical protein [Armatimonadota bacterium]